MTYDTHGDLDAILAGDPIRDETPLVLVTNHELLRVLDGHELTFAADDGTEVRVRLYNVDELLRAQKAAALALEAESGIPDPGMTREQAIRLCQPLGSMYDLALAKRGTL